MILIASGINHYKGPTTNVDSNNFITAATIFDEIKPKKIKLADTEKIKWNLNQTKQNKNRRQNNKKAGEWNKKCYKSLWSAKRGPQIL